MKNGAPNNPPPLPLSHLSIPFLHIYLSLHLPPLFLSLSLSISLSPLFSLIITASTVSCEIMREPVRCVGSVTV